MYLLHTVLRCHVKQYHLSDYLIIFREAAFLLLKHKMYHNNKHYLAKEYWLTLKVSVGP